MLAYAIYFAILAYVHVNILTDADMIFGRIDTSRWPWWLQKLWSCEYCLAGQFCLWGYLFLFDYHFINHILFIGLGIFTVHTINYIYAKEA